MLPAESKSCQVAWRARRGASILAQATCGPGEYTIGEHDAELEIRGAGLGSPHARLRVTPHELVIEDLGSSAGTFIGDSRVEGPTPLRVPATIRFGEDVYLDLTSPSSPGGADEASLPPTAARMARVWPEEKRRTQLEVGEMIGQGGMGTVFEATEPALERTVALKVISTEASEQAMGRFLAEARLTGQLEHPNIVPVHQYGVNAEGQPFYTMKRVRGLTLQTVITVLREMDPYTMLKYPLPELLSIFLRVCDAISFAHSRKIIHRDLKPANIMLGEFGEVLVMDWGLAKRLDDAEQIAPGTAPADPPMNSQEPRTLEGAVIGTPNYMAPEQARGERATFATDVYALGALLHALLYHQAPVQGESVQDVMENARHGRLTPAPDRGARAPGDYRGAVPDALAAVARRAMALEAADRYPSVAELQGEIRAYRNGFATAAEQATPLRLLALALARYRREAIIAAAALIALLIGGTVALLKVNAARNAASAALEDLRKSAPVFAAQGRALVMEGRYAEALEKIEHARQLRPDEPAYALQRADLFFAQMQFAAARDAYQAVGENERAQRSAALCARILARTAPGATPSRELLTECYELMRQEQRPAAELLPIAKVLGDEGRVTRQVWLERLRSLPIHPQPPLDSRLTILPDGALALDLSGSGIEDLTPLATMPLAVLNLRDCDHVRSLAPLHHMPLRRLDLSGTPITDLTPIAGAPLESIVLAHTRVTDLTPLSGAPLRTLDCAHTGVSDLRPLARSPLQILILDGARVRDLAPLRALPLRTLSVAGSAMVTSVATLREIPTLERLVLPQGFHEAPAAELSAVLELKNLPALQWIDAARPDGNRPESALPTAAFWAKWDQTLRCYVALKQQGLTAKIEVRADGRWEVDLQGQPVTDISMLAGAPIARLSLFNSSIQDISSLRGMPLEELDLRRTRVTDLRSLAGMPLRRLLLWQTPVADFSVLRGLRALEMLDVSQTAFHDLSLLQAPNLRELRMGDTKVTDLSPLAGSALEKLHCDKVPVRDATPLLQCKKLKWFIPPEENFDPTPLRRLPSLERIAYSWGDESVPSLTAAEFWQEYDQRLAPRK